MSVELTPAAVVTLCPVSADNVRTILRLQVADSQCHLVASNAISLAEAHFARDHAWFRAICADDTPVGFLMVHDDPQHGRYYLWRMMIDAAYQGLGFGEQAMRLLIDHIRTRPGATALTLSYVPGEGCPAPFYARFGFVETGEVHDGEREMRLDLTGGTGQPALPALAGPPLTHIVLLRLPEPSPELVGEMIGRLRSLEGKIPSLRSIEVGQNIVPSDRAYDVGLIARIDDRAGLDAYQLHPAHQEVVAWIRTVISSAVAVDWVGEPPIDEP